MTIWLIIYISMKYSLLKNGFASNKIHGKVSISPFRAMRIYEKRRTIFLKKTIMEISEKQSQDKMLQMFF